MPIDRDTLLARLEVIRQQQIQLRADFNAAEGASQAIQHLLDLLEAEVAETPPPAPPPPVVDQT